jgi:hypothetical protein
MVFLVGLAPPSPYSWEIMLSLGYKNGASPVFLSPKIKSRIPYPVSHIPYQASGIWYHVFRINGHNYYLSSLPTTASSLKKI